MTNVHRLGKYGKNEKTQLYSSLYIFQQCLIVLYIQLTLLCVYQETGVYLVSQVNKQMASNIQCS